MDAATTTLLAAQIQAGAAVVQAIGAVGAIIVVLVSDRNQARRLRDDREAAAERERQRQYAASRDAIVRRLTAIYGAANAFGLARDELHGRALHFDTVTRMTDGQLNRIRAAESAIAALLQHPTEIEPEALSALSMAAETASYWRSRAQNEQPVVGVDNGQAYIRMLEQARGELEAIFDDARERIYRPSPAGS